MASDVDAAIRAGEHPPAAVATAVTGMSKRSTVGSSGTQAQLRSPRKGKGLQDMLPGCRLMLFCCLCALLCGWFFLMLSAVLPGPALVVP